MWNWWWQSRGPIFVPPTSYDLQPRMSSLEDITPRYHSTTEMYGLSDITSSLSDITDHKTATTARSSALGSTLEYRG